MEDLKIKRRVNKKQIEKYKQYGYFSSGQTKESADTFENLMTSLNKIKTDLVSLSILLEKAEDKNVGTMSEFREVLNHAMDAKKQLKQSTFKTFLPNEIAQIKEVYSVMEEFISTLNDFTTSKVADAKESNVILLEAQNELEEQLKKSTEDAEELKGLQEAIRQFTAIDLDHPNIPPLRQMILELKDKIKNQIPIVKLQDQLDGINKQLDESDNTLEYLKKVTAGQQFPLYKVTIEELLLLIKNKVLRNENQVYEFARKIGEIEGGCQSTYYNWIHAHQGTEFI